MKKLICLVSLLGVVSLFNCCTSGYVSVQPTYQEVYRPARPGESYIWIEGNWYWNNTRGSYDHGDGYWTMPRQGGYYEPGHWTQTRHGYRWVPGQWR